MKALTHFLVMCIVVGFGLVGSVRAGDYTAANANELNALIMRLRATQFLQHATFGPKDSEIDALASRMAQIGAYPALNEWIDNQFALPVTLHAQTIREMYQAENVSPIDSAVNPIRFRYHSWWHNAITAPDQLRQRMGWALIQLFVVGEIDNFNSISNDKTGQPSWMGMTNYYDMLLTDSFGNYRTMLTDVTRHPVMGVYLSHLRNNKPNLATNVFPDENYAREIMQLFSIGLYELNPDGSYKKNAANQLIPTYDNDKIQTFARLFTGMTYAQSTSLTNGAVNFHEPMMMFEANHDKDAKNVFGATLPAGVAGLVDLNLGLDNLFNHPNVGPFVCRRLIQRLVRSNPSNTYLGRVVAQFNNNGLGVRGDMKAVIKAILLDPEAFDGIAMIKKSPTSLEVRPGLSERTRLQEPIILYAQFLRRYASSGHTTGRFLLPSLDGIWGQAPYRSPSVFNFYLPDFQPAGDITNVIRLLTSPTVNSWHRSFSCSIRLPATPCQIAIDRISTTKPPTILCIPERQAASTSRSTLHFQLKLVWRVTPLHWSNTWTKHFVVERCRTPPAQPLSPRSIKSQHRRQRWTKPKAPC